MGKKSKSFIKTWTIIGSLLAGLLMTLIILVVNIILMAYAKNLGDSGARQMNGPGVFFYIGIFIVFSLSYLAVVLPSLCEQLSQYYSSISAILKTTNIIEAGDDFSDFLEQREKSNFSTKANSEELLKRIARLSNRELSVCVNELRRIEMKKTEMFVPKIFKWVAGFILPSSLLNLMNLASIEMNFLFSIVFAILVLVGALLLSFLTLDGVIWCCHWLTISNLKVTIIRVYKDNLLRIFETIVEERKMNGRDNRICCIGRTKNSFKRRKALKSECPI